MKTTIMAGVCLLALVLTFTIAECGTSQEKRQTSCNELLQNCIAICERAGANDAVTTQCKENCETAYECSGGNDDGNGSDDDDGNGSDDDDDNYDDDDDDEGSGATAIAEATIFSTISALLVAVASAMN